MELGMLLRLAGVIDLILVTSYSFRFVHSVFKKENLAYVILLK